MTQRPKLTPRPAPRLNVKTITAYAFAGIVMVSGLLLFTFDPFSEPEGTEYIFSSVEDNLYENPANWEPEYPGTKIKKDDKIVVQDDAFFMGYDIEIDGTLEIAISAKLHSTGNNLVIRPSGKVLNEGILSVNTVENHGVLDNSLSATANLHHYRAYEYALTSNRMSADFVITESLVNEGTFNNYSSCTVGKKFVNTSSFNPMSQSVLTVKGTVLAEIPRSKSNDDSYSLNNEIN